MPDGDSILYLQFLTSNSECFRHSWDTVICASSSSYTKCDSEASSRLELVNVVPLTAVPAPLIAIVFINTRYVAPEKPAGGVQVARTLLLLI